MANAGYPAWYRVLKERHGKFVSALERLGEAVRQEGPLDDKTGHFIQMAAAAAIGSEGSVHSHVRRALAAGATPEEITHALILLTSTIGFPRVSAALSWAQEVMKPAGR
ncbi:MAG: carboxymuconolactone decarboxylase family protein [Syntrophobacterales bacterium]|nr:carboxymuconolactone decarboxylase family protein [Syntrophobacterales bacterium]